MMIWRAKDKNPPHPSGRRCTCSASQLAQDAYRDGCPLHRPRTYTVGADDVGIPPGWLELLRALNDGTFYEETRDIWEVERVRAAGLIELAPVRDLFTDLLGEDEPEDNPPRRFRLTDEGLSIVRRTGTFRVPEPTINVRARLWILALVVVVVFVLILAWGG